MADLEFSPLLGRRQQQRRVKRQRYAHAASVFEVKRQTVVSDLHRQDIGRRSVIQRKYKDNASAHGLGVTRFHPLFSPAAELTALDGGALYRKNRRTYMQPNPPKITLLTIQKEDEMKFKQAEFELVVTYYRLLTKPERAEVEATVCKQLGQRRLKANTQLQLAQGDFQQALKLLVGSLSRLSAS